MPGHEIEDDDKDQQSRQRNIVHRDLRCLAANRFCCLLYGFGFNGAEQFFVTLDRFVRIESQTNGVSSNKSPIENSTGKEIESFVFDGFEKTGVNSRFLGNFFDGKIQGLSRIAEACA